MGRTDTQSAMGKSQHKFHQQNNPGDGITNELLVINLASAPGRRKLIPDQHKAVLVVRNWVFARDLTNTCPTPFQTKDAFTW